MKRLLYIIPIILLLFISCSTKKQIVEVPVETIRTEYFYDAKVDSVFIKDSIDRYIKGDTLFIYNEHVKYKYLNKTDTVIRVDSIPKFINVEIVREVEVNHIKWYQKVLMWIGGVVSLILAGYTLYKVKLNGNK